MRETIRAEGMRGLRLGTECRSCCNWMDSKRLAVRKCCNWLSSGWTSALRHTEAAVRAARGDGAGATPVGPGEAGIGGCSGGSGTALLNLRPLPKSWA